MPIILLLIILVLRLSSITVSGASALRNDEDGVLVVDASPRDLLSVETRNLNAPDSDQHSRLIAYLGNW